MLVSILGICSKSFEKVVSHMKSVLLNDFSIHVRLVLATLCLMSSTFSFAAASLEGTPNNALTEANLDDSSVYLTLTDETFKDAVLDQGNFRLNNEPFGLRIQSVSYDSAIGATIELKFDGTDFDANITNFSITIMGAELNAGFNLTTNNMTITANIDDLVDHGGFTGDLDMLNNGLANPAIPNVVFIIDGSGSMSWAPANQNSFGIPTPGDYLAPTKDILDGSLELFAWGEDGSGNPVITPATAADIIWTPSIPTYITDDTQDGPPDPAEISHLNSFLTYVDESLDYIGNDTKPGFTPQPWTQMLTSIGPMYVDYDWDWTDHIDDGEFVMANPAAWPVPTTYIEYRWNYEGIAQEDLTIDLIMEAMYISNELGGANLAVMFTNENGDGWWTDDFLNARYNPSRDPAVYYDFYSNGAYVVEHFQDTSTLTNTHALVQSFRDISRSTDDGGSPMLEALYEARLYFGGETSPWDKQGMDKIGCCDDDIRFNTTRFFDTLDETAYVGGNISGAYKSIWDTNPCGSNHVIMYTDGEPSLDWHANDYVISEMGLDPVADRPVDDGPGVDQDYHDYRLEETLFDEYVRYLYETDLDPAKPGKQNIHTHMIDFYDIWDGVRPEGAILEGGGQYHFAQDVQETKDAYKLLFSDMLASKITGYKIKIPSKAQDALEQGDDVYVSFFDSKNGWRGNLKKFKLNASNQIINTAGEVVFSANGGIENSAVRKDFWSPGSSTDPIHTGGIAGAFDYTATTRYVQDMGNLYAINAASGVVTGLTLENSDFNLPTDAVIPNVVSFLGGKDVLDRDGDGSYTDSLSRFGDALRSEPRVFYYHRNKTTPSASKARVFYANNYGYLHSIEHSTGKEKWAIIPRAFLPSVGAVYKNDNSKFYGLDGGLEFLHLDKNGDFDILDDMGVVDKGEDGTDEKALIFSTSRRGGDLITAIDITLPDSPATAWEITSDTPDYAKLGQTWTPPKIAHLQLGKKAEGRTKPVLFVGGGYDPRYDYPSYNGSTEKGSGIYIIDAETGARVWAGIHRGRDGGERVREMNYPIVSEIKTLDTDSDGTVDLFYALDLMGQIFRCDIDDLDESASDIDTRYPGNSEINCRRRPVAKLDHPSRKRRFFAGLDAVMILDDNKNVSHIALATGSGNINTPEAVTSAAAANLDRFYTVFDPISGSSSSILPTHLSDASGGEVDWEGDGKKGWYIELQPSEKVLSTSQTFFFMTSFQTYYPNLSNAAPPPGSCTVGARFAGRTFLTDMRNAATVTDLGGTDARAKEVPMLTGLPDKGMIRMTHKPDGMVSVEISNGASSKVELPDLPALLKTYYSDEQYLK